MKDTVKNVATTLSVLMAAVTGLWFFAKAPFEAKVNDMIVEYHETNTFRLEEEERFRQSIEEYVTSNDFKSKVNHYLNQSNSDNVSLLSLLAEEMEVPESSVANEISKMYLKDRKRLRNVLRAVNELYPEYKVWVIEEDE